MGSAGTTPAEAGGKSRADVLAEAAEFDLRLVRFLYCDYGGIVRGKATHTAHLAPRLAEGIGLVVGMLAMNALDQLQPIPGMGAVGEIRLVPDPASLVRLPYTPRTGAAVCDLLTLARTPWDACPRAFLRRMIARAAERGFRIEAAFENEFFLARPTPDGGYAPFDCSLCFSTAGMESAAPFTDDLIAALEAQGLRVEQTMPEYGGGQQELSIRHAPPLRAADNQIVVRETAKAIAHRHGLVASFAPKPFPDQIGSGAHVHLSLWDAAGGGNLLHDPAEPRGFSRLGRRFVAGLLAHLPALVGLTCPSVNSYRRLRPHAWASAFVCHGFDNREAAVRIPSTYWGREAASTNLELKTVDNTCNPYLALGGIIAAGLDGIARQLEPTPPLDVDPGLLSDAEREERGYRRLPGCLPAALDALAADEVLTGALGPTIAPAYQIVRRSEAAAFAEHDEAFEFAEHFAKY